jgi:hypothetical protein
MRVSARLQLGYRHCLPPTAKLSSPSPPLWQLGFVWQEIGRKSRRTHRDVPSFGRLTPLFHNISGVLPKL